MKTKTLSVALASLVLSLTACGGGASQDVTLKVLDDFKGECEINSPIDVGYFFYCSDIKQKSVSVSYNDGTKDVTEKVNGEIYIPSYSGTYKFTCSAGGKSVSKEIVVVDQKPFISIDTNTYFHVQDPIFPDIYLDDLTQNIATSYSPSSAKLKIQKVEYAPFNLKINKGETTYTEIPVTGDHFDGSQRGLYKVHVAAVNGNREAPAVYTVIVDSSLNGGNSLVKTNGDKYCSTRVVTDPNNPNCFLLPAANWTKGASYVTLKDEHTYSDNSGKTIPDELTIRFKGKNIPTIGIYTQPDSKSGSFSNTAITKGYLVSWEQNNKTDRYTVTHSTSTFLWKTVYDNHPEYALGIQDLKDDCYYRLTIGLKTMENAYQSYTHLHSVGWTIEKIENIGTAQESYTKLSERDQYLPYDAGGWWDNYGDANGYFTIYSSSLQDIVVEVENKK